MSDFFDDLERHLDKAAHRQARWGRLASVPRAPVAAAVPVLCVAAAVAIAAPQLADREIERGPAGTGVTCDQPAASATPEPARPSDETGGGKATPEAACTDPGPADACAEAADGCDRGTPVPEGTTTRSSSSDQEGCGVPAAMAARVPELGRAPSDPPDKLRTLGAGHISFGSARLALEADGTEYWVMAKLACDTPDEGVDRVCVIPVQPDAEEPSALCATLDELDEGAPFMSFRAGDDVAVAGFAPDGARAVEVHHEGRTLTTLAVESRVFGGPVPITERRQEGELEIRAATVSPD